MSDHKFEHQVRQTLGDLKITPTSTSWEHIENGLRDRKRRRQPFLWIPVVLIAITIAGYLIWNSEGDPVAIETTSHSSQNKGLLAEAGDSSPLSPSVEENANKEDKSADEIMATGGEKISKRQPIDAHKTDPRPALNTNLKNNSDRQLNRSLPLPIKRSSGQPPLQRAREKDGGTLNNPEKMDRAIAETDRIQENSDNDRREIDLGKKRLAETSVLQEMGKKSIPGTTKEGVEGETRQSENLPQLPDSTGSGEKMQPAKIQEEKEEPTPVADLQHQAAPVHPAPVEKAGGARRAWSYGVSAFSGVSAINEGKFLNFAQPQVEDVGPALTGPNTLAAIPVPQRPSKISAGFSFAAGIVVRRDFSPRLSLSAGVNYLQLNTRTEVGHRIEAGRISNSSNNLNAQTDMLYFPGNPYSGIKEYRNRYHYIELPVTAQVRINNSDKLPVYWNAGIAASKFLSSNSLHYDGNTGVYYRNDDLITDFQASLHTGFSTKIFGKLWVGPIARYNLTSVLKKNIASKKNFMGLGLDLKWYLK